MNDATIPAVPLATPLYKEVKRQMMDALARGDWKPAATTRRSSAAPSPSPSRSRPG